jgi:hypothetical protein
MNSKVKKIRKNKTVHVKKKDNLEIYGDLLYRKSDNSTITTEQVYYKPSVPGEYVGDC